LDRCLFFGALSFFGSLFFFFLGSPFLLEKYRRCGRLIYCRDIPQSGARD
jgi:hypothetical protein